VHAEHCLHGETLEQAVGDHFSGATTTFLCGLEDQVDGAVEIPVFRQVLRGGQQHRGVAIVAAGVHLAGVLAGVGEGVEFLHGQGVHVGAQANAPAAGAAVAAMDDANHPGLAHATVYGNAPFGEFLGHQVGGANLLEAEFGVGVDVASDLRQGCCLGEDGVVEFHTAALLCAGPPMVPKLTGGRTLPAPDASQFEDEFCGYLF